MANYYATARSNYVKVLDLPGLTKSLAHCSIDIQVYQGKDPELQGKYTLLSHDEGGWPSFIGSDDSDDYDNGEIPDLDFHIHVMPFIEEGEVLVVMEVGNERMRYVVGEATAFVRIGEEVKEVNVGLGSIYDLAATEFAIERNRINPAEY